MGDNLSRQKFPEITTPESVLRVKGYIKYPMKLLELSSANITKNKPYIVQNLNIDEVSSILKKETHPFYLNLESDDDYSFTKIQRKMKINISLIICTQDNGFYFL